MNINMSADQACAILHIIETVEERPGWASKRHLAMASEIKARIEKALTS